MEILKQAHTHADPAENGNFMPTKGSKKAPESTFEEVKYLRHLIENTIPVCIHLSDNEEVCGTIEFFDANLIRLTRPDAPNLFLYKHEIKYLYEKPA